QGRAGAARVAQGAGARAARDRSARGRAPGEPGARGLMGAGHDHGASAVDVEGELRAPLRRAGLVLLVLGALALSGGLWLVSRPRPPPPPPPPPRARRRGRARR